MRSRPFLAFLAALLALAAMPPLRGAITVTVSPQPMTTADTGILTITSDRNPPEVPKLPTVPGLTWISGPQTSKSFELRNFQTTVTATTQFLFRVAKPGRISIPSFPVQEGRATVATDPLTFTVVEAATAAAAPAPTAELVTVPGGLAGDELVPGQAVTIELRVSIPEAAYQALDYPTLEPDNAAWLEPLRPDPKAPRLEQPAQQREVRNGVPYTLTRIRARLTPIKPGDLTVTASIRAALREPRQLRRGPLDDPFLDDFFNRAPAGRPVELNATLGPVKVAPLPPPPPGCQFLGLVGQWQATLDQDKKQVAVGDPVTLTLRLAGTGNEGAFIPPALAPPGFRTFAPEVKKSRDRTGSQVQATWTLVPLQPGAKLPELRFCTYDPETKEHRPLRFTPELAVTPAPAGGAATAEGSADSARAPRPPATPADELLGPKASPGRGVRLPLWRNGWKSTLALAAAGFLSGLAGWLAARRRERLARDPETRRRTAARHALAAALRRLAATPPADAAAQDRIFREELLPALAARLALPPGATAAEIAARLRSSQPELAARLEEAEAAAFRPGGPARIEPETLRRLLRQAGFILVALLFFAWPASSQAAAATTSFADGLSLYARGEFAKALAVFETLAAAQPDSASPALLLNQGNCLCRLGRPAAALARYERAWRLSPRDPEIRENRDLLRRQLNLPPTRAAESPAATTPLRKLRDWLRPDEWARLAILAAAGGAAAAGWRRWRGTAPAWPLLAAGVAAALLAGAAALSQLQGPYRPGQALVTRPGITLCRLPDEQAEPAGGQPRLGESVLVQERRGGWARIQAEAATGWLPADSLEPVW